MSNKYLDLTGLQTYHNEMVSKIVDLEYDPERLFEEKIDLFDLNKWGANKYGRVVGLKAGLMVTVEGKVWQLENPTRFNRILSRAQSAAEKAELSPEELGWIVVGSSMDFNIADHTLQLIK